MSFKHTFSYLLRAHTDLDVKKSLQDKTEEDGKHKISRWKESNKGVTWKELKIFSEQQTPGKDVKQISKQYQELWRLTKELIGSEESVEIVEEAAVFLIHLFVDQKMVLMKHLAKMRNMFGEVSTQLATKIWTAINELSSSIPQSCKELILSSQVTDNGELQRTRKPLDEPWGGHIEYSDHEKIDDNSLVLSDFEEVEEKKVDFSMKYESYDQPSTSRAAVKTEKLYTQSWLEKEINPDVVPSVIEMLKTSRTNDDLQNELFDLLGFDAFEVIEKILQNRKSILLNIDLSDKKRQLKETMLNQPQAPLYTRQVIVQSEQERLLMKQLRKDEKKLKSKINNISEDDDAETDLTIEKFNVMYQRSLLKEAQTQPVFRPLVIPTAPQPKFQYPFVFDAQGAAKNHIGYMANPKIVLSDDVERIQTKMYEEVRIPASSGAPLEVGNTLVQIDSLDEIGKIAFKGIKELNRIQSVVYSAAYYTNDNLLVCAPTGAGKTNVAMLTIVNTIRAHANAGVIDRDAFKIVYVAPMKALAAEMADNFGKRLRGLNVAVRELTGDMQLTKTEMQQTQMLVTTPEKWDVVTRKGAGDAAMISLVKLLIIDEVHLLHGDRGPVVEALVARTLRLVESSQSMIRIVGLSATLPNYIDVARFLRVNPMVGLFFFDSRFRPIPLSQTFIGVKAIKPLQQLADMDIICYDKCLEMLRKGHQVMVFVHARNATVRTANVLREMAQQKGHTEFFVPEESSHLGQAINAISRSRNKQLVELFQSGLAMHHAGMLRTDRSLVEKYFGEGFIKVLVCTATLAWGVNLPAHAVIIKGTEIYDAKRGSFVDLGILDVLQIFGRAGRPQFDKSGCGIIITAHEKLNHYLSLLTNQFPIESNFIQCLADNLNAEITLGTIANVDEAIQWLRYTYLFVRMPINPLVYGINYQEVQADHTLERKCRELISTAALALDKAEMIRFNQRTGDLNVTDLGRTASHFYIKYDTVEVFNELLCPVMSEGDIISMVSHAQEFQQLKVRDDEMDELDELTHGYCELIVSGGSENLHGKVNVLMQTFLSRGFVKSFSLASDMSYITQNAARIVRALFTILLQKNNALLAGRLLTMSKMFERKMWDFETPLRQFYNLPVDVIEKIDGRGIGIHALREMDSKEIGIMLRNQKYGGMVAKAAEEFPMLEIDAVLQPITRTVLRIRIFITANFRWNDRIHGKRSEPFWIWIEDPESNFIYHSELFMMTRKQVITREAVELVMTIPLKEPLPPQYYIRAISDSWLGSQLTHPLSFQHLILPDEHPPHTELLPLHPLPVSVLDEPRFEALYKFTHFNPIQTQIFHCLYHTDNNVLLGAPTGSGKTIAAEMAMFRVFRTYPKGKVVYIAPLKALVRERIADWKVRIEERLKKRVVELTGDVTPDVRAIREASVIVTTPEKWDGISRSWQTRDYVREVALIIIDEIHLLGEDRGPVLEVIVSRTNFIASHTERTLRIVGLSTALANAKDLANWLGIGQMGLFNFKPSVRPVPLSVHIHGFPLKAYCPRMATMNRPSFQAIRQYSPTSPVLIFVSSRRQTRLTALDLIAFLAGEENPKQYLNLPDDEMVQILQNIQESNLKLTLAFGIGLHHAGLVERDRKTVEELFLHQKIQVLVATATLAWGVNLPAHLVIIKGTEYYDGKQKRYVDMPITDVLQMMGRAGRPQFDTEGVAVVYVHDIKKNFYKKFLYDPFPVESSLLAVLPDHVNAELVAGTVQTQQSVLDYLTWTYFFRRLLRNPTFYDLAGIEPADVNQYLTRLVTNVLNVLITAGCVECVEEERMIYPTSMGRIASYYYLAYQTMRHFADTLCADMTMEEILRAMCDAHEFNQQPVRHNEDIHNTELATLCRLKVDPLTCDSPHTKTFLLMQAHFSRLPLPNADYLTDTKSVLDQAIRVIQAMIDVCAEHGWLATTLRIQQLMQCIVQARWLDDPVGMCLPHVEEFNADVFEKVKRSAPYLTLPSLKEACQKRYEVLANPLRDEFSEPEIEHIFKVLNEMPTINVEIRVRGAYHETDVVRPVPQPPATDKGGNAWMQLHAKQEYTIIVQLYRLGVKPDKSIYCPKFPKGKDEGWFLTLGCRADSELIAIKRVVYKSNRSSHQLTFEAPATKGRLIYTLYLLSDGYIGLDQQYDLHLDVIDPLPERDQPEPFYGIFDDKPCKE